MHGLPFILALTVMMHGHPQNVRTLGDPAGPPVIVSSGDGGWMHLAPHVASWLVDHGYRVIGLDAKAYLSSSSGGSQPLSADTVPRDYLALLDATTRPGGPPPILIGISEGAGLSVRAAADPAVRARVGGVIALGLGDRNELAWRWRDSIIYFTKGVPNEPTFNAHDYLAGVSPVPLALIRSTHDEFVPNEESAHLASIARDPSRLWTVAASDHRFSDNLTQLDGAMADAIAWARDHRSH
jgi:hypothetical protein